MKIYEDLAVIILAAGKGTRMKSDLAKVLHKVAEKSMVVHVIDSAKQIARGNIHIVIGHQAEGVQKEISSYHEVQYAVQKQLLGTGDAVKAALPKIDKTINHVLVLCGDVPLIKAQTIEELVLEHIQSKAGITVLAVDLENPSGYGRIITDDGGQVLSIREEADATPAEKKINKVNTGIYCFDKTLLADGIDQLEPDNNQAEYYLTDVIEIAQKKGEQIISQTMNDPDQVIGVNTLQELDRVNRLFQNRQK